MNKGHRTDFKKGDEVSYAMPAGMLYGAVTRVLGAGDTAAVEIEFEDGRKEVKKVKDRALSLLRRASGLSEEEEGHSRPEIDHGAFSMKDEDLTSLARKLTEYKIQVIDQTADRMIIRDPFGLMLELWPRTVLQKMGLL